MGQAQRAFIALLLLFVIWCGWQSRLSSQFLRNSTQQPSAQNTSAESTERQKPHNDGGWSWITKDSAGFFTMFLVIIGGGQFILFWVQLRFIRESLDDAKIAADAAKDSANATARIAKSDRAWVCSEEITSGESINGFVNGVPCARGLMITPKWRNVGRSPALRALIIGDSRIIQPGDPIPTFAPGGILDQARATIAPGISVTSVLGFDEQTYIALEQGRLRLILYLGAFYYDIYSPGEEHITEACVEVAFDGRKIRRDGTSEPNIHFRVVGQQNRMT